AGYDIASSMETIIEPKSYKVISTNLCLKMTDGCFAKVYSKSGLTVKHGIHVGAGVIDSGYTGEIKVALFNFGEKDYKVTIGSKIAQLIFHPLITCSSKNVIAS
ncbi:dUTPase-like protein, partial [Syncephalis pseudoplumigaleata]